MDSKDTGRFLSSVFPVDDDLSELLVGLNRVEKTAESSFLPSMMLRVPQCYRTRNKRRVDICGTVDQASCEYAEGLRYYSSEGEFFYEDGRCLLGNDNPCDLLQVIDDQDLPTTIKPVSPYMWIHPQHWDGKTWFAQLTPSKSITPGTYYRNRMGLVIEIVKTSHAPGSDNAGSCLDCEGRSYQSDGLAYSDRISMYDLVAEIRHWPIFKEQDWSSDKGVVKKAKGAPVPELFDPTRRLHVKDKMTEFFAAMTRVNDLADELGIDLGFHMNTKGVNFG